MVLTAGQTLQKERSMTLKREMERTRHAAQRGECGRAAARQGLCADTIRSSRCGPGAPEGGMG